MVVNLFVMPLRSQQLQENGTLVGVDRNNRPHQKQSKELIITFKTPTIKGINIEGKSITI